MLTTDKVLERCLEIYRQRQPIYGNNAPKVGRAMHALFPDGVTLKTPEDFTRLYLLMMSQVKCTRYANNFNKGGHTDSAMDACVYMAMLQSTDDGINEQ